VAVSARSCGAGSYRGARVPNLPGYERMLREHLDAFSPAACAEILRVLILPDFDRARMIGEYLRQPEDAGICRAAHRPGG